MELFKTVVNANKNPGMSHATNVSQLNNKNRSLASIYRHSAVLDKLNSLNSNTLS